MPKSHQLAAIMFTDIVGYSALMGEDEQHAIRLLNKNRQIQKPLIEKYHGKLLKEIGDGILASFDSVSDAVYCAGEIQRISKNEPELKLRVGIHQGEVLFENDDVFGSGVNIASRLESMAPVGGILVSEEVHNNINNKTGIKSHFSGTEQLKNIKGPVNVYQVRIEGTTPLPGPTMSVEKTGRPRGYWIKLLAGMILIIGLIYYLFTAYLFTAKQENPEATPEEQVVSIGKSIAIIPFKNLSDEEGSQYFSDGMMDAILSSLSKLEDIKVISRTSMEQYRDGQKTIPVIAEELKVTHILEGSVQRDQNRMRFILQLIDADNDQHVWSETYDRELTDLFEVQTEIASQIVSELKGEITSQERQVLDWVPTDNLESYLLYLRGKFFLSQRNKEGFQKSIDLFQQALQFDPMYALAYVGLAEAYALMGSYNLLPMKESLVQAKAMATKALLIDDQLAEAHASMATISHDAWDWNAAEKHFEKAVSLNPNYAQVRQWYSEYLTNIGKFDRGIEEAKKARELDPLSYAPNLVLGINYYKARRYDEAIESLERTRDQFSNYGITYLYIALAHFMKEEFDMSISVLKKGIEVAPYTTELRPILAYVYAKTGKEEEAIRLSKEVMEESRERYFPSILFATMYVGLDELDEAFVWFEKSYQQHDWQLSFLAVEPVFDPIRNDPRFIELLNKVGYNTLVDGN